MHSKPLERHPCTTRCAAQAGCLNMSVVIAAAAAAAAADAAAAAVVLAV
jgi:hypothetical protein